VHLVRIAVDPPHQGEQIGIRLMAEVVGFAAEQAATMVTLNTQAYNTHAQRLYRWFGFAPSGERQLVLQRHLSDDT
jgi:ribosomal protein S18 acetylase RimI-like enzyme